MHIGELRIEAVSDGTFVARPSYFGGQLEPDARPDIFRHDGSAWWPIGCFLIRGIPGRTILVDAGLGPEMQPMDGGMLLCGGQLPTGLYGLGCAFEDITDVVCTHLHVDHVGWLFDSRNEPLFGNATYHFGPSDLEASDSGAIDMAGHIRAGFADATGHSRLHPVTQDETIAAGLTIRVAAGHTPGGLILDVESDNQRLLLLGDAITSPLQAANRDWHSTGDLDLPAADSVRDWIWRTLTEPNTYAVGAHFEFLRAGRIDPDNRAWQPMSPVSPEAQAPPT